jgi:hypothetical protein
MIKTAKSRPTFYAEVVCNNKGMELLSDAWFSHGKSVFMILTYWHQIHDPHETPKKVITLAELIICPITLQRLKSIEASATAEVIFKLRRVDLEGYQGWDSFDND